MARERYLVGDDVETIHRDQIVLKTKKDKWNNWWDYHYKIVIVSVICLACLISLFYSIFSKIEPDYSIGIITSTYLSETTQEELANQILPYASDINGDGDITVHINYLFVSEDTSYAEDTEASVVKYIADVSEGESVIWILDDYGYNYFAEEADTVLMDISEGENSKLLNFNDLIVFDELEITSYYDGWTSEEYKDATLSKFYVAVRSYDGFNSSAQKNRDIYIEASYEIYEKLLTGEGIVTVE